MVNTSVKQNLDDVKKEGHDLADVTVIGAGIAGLLAALEMLDQNLTVNLVEKRRYVGGRATSTSRDGFTLNQGPHAVYIDGELHRALKKFAVLPTGAQPSKNMEGIAAGRRGRLPEGLRMLLGTTLFSAEAKLRLVPSLHRISRQNLSELADVSVEKWVESLSGNSEVQRVLKGLATLATYTAALDQASADATAKTLQLVLDTGVMYIDGGWQTIIDSLQHRLEDSVRLRRIDGSVTCVTAEDRTWVTTVEGDQLRSKTVLVATGSPESADRLFGTNTFADAAGPDVSVSVLDLGIVAAPTTPVLLDFNRSLYLSDHSTARNVSPENRSLVTLARYRRPDDTMSADETQRILRRHAQAAGIEQEQIVMRRYLHGMTVAHGTPLAASGGLLGRPAVSVANRAGAFVAGDWVGDVGLLADASAASALDAAAGVVSYLAESNLRLMS